MSTYTPIASITLASAASSVTFSGIPQTYTDLVLVTNTYLSTGGQSGNITYNGDTASNYSVTFLGGNGSTASSSRSSSRANLPLDLGYGYSSSNFGTYTAHIQNYTNTTTFKTMISRGGQAGIGTNATAGLWRSTSAITSITCGTSGGDYVAGSTFNLYGIANASLDNVAKATGGDSVTTDGTYWYHIFRSSGTFRPTQALTADYLVVAGGGSGGDGSSSVGSGGGGAGGLIYQTGVSLTTSAQTITIGAGGSASNGSDTTVGSLYTAKGGGRGGRGSESVSTAGSVGGSGGGGAYRSSLGSGASGNQTSQSGNSGTFGFGNSGGNGRDGQGIAGGGGGAGGAGQSAIESTKGGDGGIGRQYTAFATPTGTGANGGYYAGGGAGNSEPAFADAVGGLGGGGNGGKGSTQATSGIGNTGGGGGGSSRNSPFTAGAGGSGIVIVRYAA